MDELLKDMEHQVGRTQSSLTYCRDSFVDQMKPVAGHSSDQVVDRCMDFESQEAEDFDEKELGTDCFANYNVDLGEDLNEGHYADLIEGHNAILDEDHSEDQLVERLGLRIAESFAESFGDYLEEQKSDQPVDYNRCLKAQQKEDKGEALFCDAQIDSVAESIASSNHIDQKKLTVACTGLFH